MMTVLNTAARVLFTLALLQFVFCYGLGSFNGHDVIEEELNIDGRELLQADYDDYDDYDLNAYYEGPPSEEGIGINTGTIEEKQEGCSTDVGKACASANFCSKFSDRFNDVCVACANELATGDPVAGKILDLSQCSSCSGSSGFEAGLREQSEDLKRECNQKELTARLAGGSGSSSSSDPADRDFADKSGPCQCISACYDRGSWTPGKCYANGGKKSCQVAGKSCNKNIRERSNGYYICCK